MNRFSNSPRIKDADHPGEVRGKLTTPSDPVGRNANAMGVPITREEWQVVQRQQMNAMAQRWTDESRRRYSPADIAAGSRLLAAMERARPGTMQGAMKGVLDLNHPDVIGGIVWMANQHGYGDPRSTGGTGGLSARRYHSSPSPAAMRDGQRSYRRMMGDALIGIGLWLALSPPVWATVYARVAAWWRPEPAQQLAVAGDGD
jgi:hypothetical protein